MQTVLPRMNATAMVDLSECARQFRVYFPHRAVLCSRLMFESQDLCDSLWHSYDPRGPLRPAICRT